MSIVLVRSSDNRLVVLCRCSWRMCGSKISTRIEGGMGLFEGGRVALRSVRRQYVVSFWFVGWVDDEG